MFIFAAPGATSTLLAQSSANVVTLDAGRQNGEGGEETMAAGNTNNSQPTDVAHVVPLKESQLPDAPSSYTPLSAKGKFDIFLRTTYAPSTFVSGAFSATLAQAEGQWPGYGGGMPGWGKRFGASLADTEARRFIQGFVLSSVLRQDPRYFPCPKKGFFVRGWYAVTRVLITRGDDGNDEFNSSEFLGVLFASSLQNSYYPDRDRGFGKTMSRVGGALSSDATSNLLKEFWPDIRRIFRRHAPEKIRKLEDKIPAPVKKMAVPK